MTMVTGAKLVAVPTWSWPGSSPSKTGVNALTSRPSRWSAHCALLIEIAGTSPAMTRTRCWEIAEAWIKISTSAKGGREESEIAASARPYANSNRSTSSARWRHTTAMSSRTAMSSQLNACRANSAHSAACARYRSARTSTGVNALIRGFPAVCSGTFMAPERNTTISVPESRDIEENQNQDG